MPEDASQVGQDKTYNDATEAYDAAHGKYKDNAEGLTPDQALPSGGPLPAQPNPFKLGPLG
jgi:hypothetical protein